jgi:hypothetical protein
MQGRINGMQRKKKRMQEAAKDSQRATEGGLDN